MHFAGLSFALWFVLCVSATQGQGPTPPSDETLPSSLDKEIFIYEVEREELESKEGLFHVSVMAGQNVGKVTTRDKFSPTFDVTWVVSTDGGNIRFYYAQLIIILNHESGRHTLQVADPALGQQRQRMIPELGRVSPNEFHEVKLIVEEDSYTFTVDGEVRAGGDGDYKGLKDAVSIGPAFGSHLRLRHFEIHR